MDWDKESNIWLIATPVWPVSSTWATTSTGASIRGGNTFVDCQLRQRLTREAVLVSVKPMRVLIWPSCGDKELLGLYLAIEISTVPVRPARVVRPPIAVTRNHDDNKHHE